MNNKRNVSVLYITGVVILIISYFVCVFLGSTNVDFESAFNALFYGDFQNSDLRIILFVRLPRCLGAVFSGMSLAVSGVLIQAVLNNPMASPNIIGVNSGAGFASIAIVSLFPDFLMLVPVFAFLGALITSILIYILARICGAGKITITLVGIAITSVLNAIINAFKSFFPDSIYNFTSFSVGGLGGININILGYALPIIIVCFIVSIILSRNVDILSLGEDTAYHLGMNVNMQRFILLIVASALAGSAVSFAGLIGFVGLVVPHIIRIFVGNKHIVLIPLSAIYGAVFVLLCDLFCRIAFKPYEIPVGIILSIFGGIFFIFLIISHRKGTLYD